jgi:hypothetical protein
MTVRRRRRVAKPQTVPNEPVAQVLTEPQASGEPPAGVDGEVNASPSTITPMTDAIRAQGLKPDGGPIIDSSVPKRRRRASVGGHALKLSAPTREGVTRRWVNDDGNRIAEARELGYDFVSETGIQTADPGSHISRLVGTKANGEPLHAHLMETPNELYAEGVAEKEAANRLIDEAITAGRDSTGRLENQYGHGSIKVER